MQLVISGHRKGVYIGKNVYMCAYKINFERVHMNKISNMWAY